MHKSFVVIIAVSLAACGVGALDSSSAVSDNPVPRVGKCDATSMPETGLQGQVPIADRQSGRSELGYSCNLERVGQWAGDGASWQHAWFEDCAYYGTGNGAGQEALGVVAVDVSDPTNPVGTAHLPDPAGFDPWESLKVTDQRKLLVGVNANGGFGGPEVGIYDIAADCAHPTLLYAAAPAGNTMVGHAGNVVPDGLTYYGASLPGPIFAFDITDPAAPSLYTELPLNTHDIGISEDGNRLYLAQIAAGAQQGGANGLVIVDASRIQSRAAPAYTVLGTVTWGDGAIAQEADPVTIGGNPYIIFSDEGGKGAARIIDISNENLPAVVSKMKLEVHLPENATVVDADNDPSTTFRYEGHYCSVDNPANAEIVACSYFQSGLRIFDIRDPAAPKEIAYYNPPAMVGASRPGSENSTVDKAADWASANVRILRDRNEIWFTSQDNGFQVLRFTTPIETLLAAE
jgi:hypothetical protein